jgi:ABC-type transporter MlaC component
MRLIYLGMVELNSLNRKKSSELQSGKLHKLWREQVMKDWGKVLTSHRAAEVEVKTERRVNSWDIFERNAG